MRYEVGDDDEQKTKTKLCVGAVAAASLPCFSLITGKNLLRLERRTFYLDSRFVGESRETLKFSK
jgi:hypothetical protein